MSRDRAKGRRTHILCALFLALFTIAASFSAYRKDVAQGFDELAHASYVASLQQSRAFWPPLETLRMLDPQMLRFTREANYLNHPPPYYLSLAWIGPKIEGSLNALFAHRLINVLLVLAGLTAVIAVAFRLGLATLETYAYVVALLTIPVLGSLAGAINNDNLAFAGGALAIFSASHLLATGQSKWFFAALAGAVAASFAKLTGLMLVVGFLTCVSGYLWWRGRFKRNWALPLAIALLLAIAPYLAFVAEYGSPAPNTSAHVAILTDGARNTGWAFAERLAFPAYAVRFVQDFLAGWMPSLAERNKFHYFMLALPVAFVVCAVAGLWLSLARMLHRSEKPLDVIVIAGWSAIIFTFVVHLIFSFERHTSTGWMLDAYPRYYLPLAATIPLAALSLAAAIRSSRLYYWLIGFLILGPILFRVLGGPIEG